MASELPLLDCYSDASARTDRHTSSSAHKALYHVNLNVVGITLALLITLKLRCPSRGLHFPICVIAFGNTPQWVMRFSQRSTFLLRVTFSRSLAPPVPRCPAMPRQSKRLAACPNTTTDSFIWLGFASVIESEGTVALFRAFHLATFYFSHSFQMASDLSADHASSVPDSRGEILDPDLPAECWYAAARRQRGNR